MGIMVGLPSPSGSEKNLQLNFGKNMTVQVEMRAPHLPAEWHLQSGIYAERSTRMFCQHSQRNCQT